MESNSQNSITGSPILNVRDLTHWSHWYESAGRNITKSKASCLQLISVKHRQFLMARGVIRSLTTGLFIVAPDGDFSAFEKALLESMEADRSWPRKKSMTYEALAGSN